jgi:uncharacterized protein YggE
MKQSLNIKINAWIICAVLLVANLITIGFWQPWANRPISTRTIAITGSTTIEAEADQFIFSPYYQKDNADKVAANAELSMLAGNITTKLKELGVANSAIKTDVNSYESSIYYSEQPDSTISTLYVTITIRDKDLAQKVQDYIVTTSPVGSITPQISFSNDKQKTLETQARKAALIDAKSKAEASAKQLGAKIGRVASVKDNNYGGISPMPWMTSTDVASPESTKSSSSSYSIQPGLNEYSFSIEVTYELN